MKIKILLLTEDEEHEGHEGHAVVPSFPSHRITLPETLVTETMDILFKVTSR